MAPTTTQLRDEFDSIIQKELKLAALHNSTDDALDRLASFYERYIKDFILKFKFRDGKHIFDCKIFYADTDQFNAYSLKSRKFDSVYYIGLNFELVDKLIKIHKNYGQKEKCKFDALKIPHSDCKWPETILQINIALAFVIFHELGHILFGHCELDKEKIVSSVGEKADIHLLQAEEYLADLFATIMSISIMKYEEDEKDINYLSQNYCEACYKFWKIIKFYDGSFSDYVGKLADHPHASVRMLYLKDYVDSEMKYHGLRDRKTIKTYSSNCKLLLDSKDQVRLANAEKCLIEKNLDEIFNLFQAFSYYDFPDYKTMNKEIVKSIHRCFGFV